MKTLRLILGLHVSTLIIFGFLFPLLIWGIGLIFPNQANGLPVIKNNQLIGYENIGQLFNSEKYFHGRPSAVNYNASATGGSNKGPTNPEQISAVKNNVETFLQNNPEVKRSDIPIEMVTASGSGLDPHISLRSALIQVPRISKARGIPETTIKNIIDSLNEKPLFGLFGPEKINVLKLNLALDSFNK